MDRFTTVYDLSWSYGKTVNDLNTHRELKQSHDVHSLPAIPLTACCVKFQLIFCISMILTHPGTLWATACQLLLTQDSAWRLFGTIQGNRASSCTSHKWPIVAPFPWGEQYIRPPSLSAPVGWWRTTLRQKSLAMGVITVILLGACDARSPEWIYYIHLTGIRPSIIYTTYLWGSWGSWNQSQLTLGQKAGYSLCRSPVYHRYAK